MGCINDKNLNTKSKRQQIQSKFPSSPNPMYAFVNELRIRIAKEWNVDMIK